jgi:glucan biosynthesis protein
MSLAARFQAAFFHAVGLKQPIEVRRLTPAAFKVVVADPALFDVKDDRIPPVRETDRVASGFPAKQRDSLLNGFSQLESTAG